MKNKIKEIQEVRDTKKAIKELERILEEIKDENAKMPSDERIEEIVKGRKGRLEEAKTIAYDLRENNKKSVRIKGIKNLIIAANIALIALPYVLVGGITYGVMSANDCAPYHQNTHQSSEVVYEYWNSFGENKFLTEKEMEEYNKHSLIVYTPWQQNEKGEYFRNRFYEKRESISVDEVEKILSTDVSDLLADHSFDDITVETAKEKPEKMDAEIEIIQKHKKYGEVKENSKKQIIGFSIGHALGTLSIGSLAVYATHIAIRDKKNKRLFAGKLEELEKEKEVLYDKEKKASMRKKIKELRKK